MNNEKKLAVQQQHINDLEKEIHRLKTENQILKQVLPTTEKIQDTHNASQRLQEVLAETIALKIEYTSALQSFSEMRQSYITQMDDLLAKLRKSVKQAENSSI